MVGQLADAEDHAEDQRTDDRKDCRLQGLEEALEDHVDDLGGDERLPQLVRELSLALELPDHETDDPGEDHGRHEGVDAVSRPGLGSGSVEEDGSGHQLTFQRRSSIAAPNEIASTMMM